MAKINDALKGRRTYLSIATVLVGIGLSKVAPTLPHDAASVLTPELVGLVADALMAIGAGGAVLFRKIANAPVDEQDRVTPRP
jgi:hypothetical protein